MHTQECTLEVYSGLMGLFWYKRFFKKNGFAYEKRVRTRSYYHKNFKTREECKKYQKQCRKRGLNFKVFEKGYVRSSDYRKNFLEQKAYSGNYTICAYCGLPLRVSKITVDHIIPVYKVKNTFSGRFLMKTIGIHDVNDYKNLCAACKRCNSRKGSKMGLWIIKGYIGKSMFLWSVRWIIRLSILFFLIQRII